MKGDLQDVDYESSEEMDEDEEDQQDMVTLDFNRPGWGFKKCCNSNGHHPITYNTLVTFLYKSHQ